MPEPSSSSPIFQSQHDLGRTHETAASWLRERSKAATSKQSHFTKGLERRLRKPRETQASSLHDGSSELSQSTVLYVTSESPVTVRGCQHYVQRRQPEASEISTRPDATYETASTTSQPPPDRPHPSRRKGRSTELRQPTVVSASEESHLESTPEALRIVHPYEVEMSPPTSDASRGYTGSRPYLVDLDSDLTGLYGPMTCLVFSDPGEVVISLSMYPPPRPPKIPLSRESHSDSGRYELPAIPPTEGQAFAAHITDFESFIGPSDDPPNYSEVDGPRQSKIRWSKFQSEYSRVKSRIATRFRIFRPTSYGPSISQSSGYQSSSHSDPNSHAPSDSTPTRRPEWPSCLSRPAKRIIGKARAGRHANAMSTYLQDLALDMAKPKSPESIDPTRQSVPDSSMGSSRRFSSETPGQSRSDDQNLYWDSRFSVKDSPLTDSDFTGPRPSVWMFMGRAYRPRSPIQEASTVAPSHQYTSQVDPSEVETGWGLETLTAMGI